MVPHFLLIGHNHLNVLIDTGAARSDMSEKYYQILMLPKMKHLYNVSVR